MEVALAVKAERIEVMKVRLPDGLVVCSHNIEEVNVQKLIRHWTERHSDEYEIRPFHVDKIYASQTKYDGMGNLVHAEGDVIDVSIWQEDGHGRKVPRIVPELVDVPEQQYRAMKPYEHDPTWRHWPSP